MKHWVLERLSSIRLIPIVSFVLYSLIDSSVVNQLRVSGFGGAVWILAILLAAIFYYHLRVGAESLLRDYVHTAVVLTTCRLVLDRVILCRGKDTILLLTAAFV